MNIFNRLSLKSLFLVSPLIGLILILILFFSSYSIIRSHQNIFEDMSQTSLPQIGEFGLASVLLMNNHTKLTALLVSASEKLDEEQLYLQSRGIVDDLYRLSEKFENLLANENKWAVIPNQINLLEQIEGSFRHYKTVSIGAIELAALNVNLALRELAVASYALETLNMQLLELTKRHVQVLTETSKEIKTSFYNDDLIIILTVILIFIMLYVAVYFSSRISTDLEQINHVLLGLAKGQAGIQLPEKAGRYLEQLTTIVEKFKGLLLQNEEHEESLQRSIDKLKESQNRYYQMFETNQAVKIIIDVESGKIVEANEAATKFYGYDAQTLITMRISDINIADKVNIKKDMKLAKDNEATVFNFRHKLSSNEIRDVEVYSGPIQSDGKALLYSIVHDVTERNIALRSLFESERKYRSIIQSTVVAIIVTDQNGCVQEWNTGAAHVFGYTEKEVHGKPLALLMPERFKKLHEHGFSQAIKNKGLMNSEALHEVSGVRKNGEEFPMELTLGSWAIGEEVFFSAMILDVSQRKRAELGLRRSQKMDAVGQLTGGIAHDFNNILGIILGNLDLLERQIDRDEKAQKRIDGIRRSAQRAADLTRQLLGFSRRETESVSVININTVINNMRGLIGHSMTPQIEVNYQFADDLWNTSIDSGDFEDALLNLILNARDAMSGRGRITIETINKELDEEYCAHSSEDVTPGSYVELVISDDGEGIPHALQERIFEPFFTTKDQGKGTGLGLAMVFGFVQRSKGSIRIYSEPDIGTTFRLFLPKEKVVSTENKFVNKTIKTLPRGNETLLLVDDEEGLLEVASETLKELGYKVITAENAKQALQRLDEEPEIKLLFSDVVMPEMNGYELAEKALQEKPGIRILLTSGYTEKAMLKNKQFEDVYDLLSKPYTQADLADGIRGKLDELVS